MSEKENFSFSSRKLWTLDFSFSSQNRGTGFYISLSLLESGDIVFTFSFSSRSLSIENPFLFLLSKVEHILLEFSFPSRNWRKEFPVSLSSLETGEKNFWFLFLFSIGPFGLSSMTATALALHHLKGWQRWPQSRLWCFGLRSVSYRRMDRFPF